MYFQSNWNSVQNVYISAQLANNSIQMRHIPQFNGILRLIDTPRHTIQGFIVDISCNNFRNIFTQVCYYLHQAFSFHFFRSGFIEHIKF